MSEVFFISKEGGGGGGTASRMSSNSQNKSTTKRYLFSFRNGGSTFQLLLGFVGGFIVAFHLRAMPYNQGISSMVTSTAKTKGMLKGSSTPTDTNSHEGQNMEQHPYQRSVLLDLYDKTKMENSSSSINSSTGQSEVVLSDTGAAAADLEEESATVTVTEDTHHRLLPFVIEYCSLLPSGSSIRLSSMEGMGKCQKTIVFEDSRDDGEVGKKFSSIEMRLATVDGFEQENLLCVQKGTQIGAAIGRDGQILHGTDLASYVKWLEDQDGGSCHDSSGGKKLPPYRVVDLKYVVMDGNYLPSTIEANNARRKPDGNKGNFVWQYGAGTIVNPYTTKVREAVEAGYYYFLCIFLSLFRLNCVTLPSLEHSFLLTSLCPQKFVDKKDWRTSAYIFASANLFLMNRDTPKNEEMMQNMAKIYTDRVTKYDLPSIVFGIGVQVEFDQVQNVSSLSLEGYDVYKKLIHEFSSRHDHRSIAVRGDVTELACRNSGYSKCISMGCPSLTISRNMNLGRTLQTKWNKVMTALQAGGEEAKKLKIVLTVPAIQLNSPTKGHLYRRLTDMLLSLYEQHDCYFIMQSDYDRPNLMHYTNHTLDPSRVLTFDDKVEEWFEFISGMDIVVSTRIHGGMAGISNQVPAVIIPTDFRILELVNAMKLPTLPMGNVETTKYDSLMQLMEDIPVDYEGFETNRRRKIREYKRMLEGIGLEIEPNLAAIIDQP